MGTLFLVLSVAFNTAANSLFKMGSSIEDLTVRKATLLGLGLLVGLMNTLCYIKALENIELGAAYTVFSAASILLIAIASYLFFHETWSLQKLAGLATIFVGLLLVWKS